MNLKCVGGSCDGDTVHVGRYYGIGGIVPVPAKIEFKIMDFEESLEAFRQGKTPESMSIPYHHYKVEIIYFSKDDGAKFLIPPHWKIKDAILHLLSK